MMKTHTSDALNVLRIIMKSYTLNMIVDVQLLMEGARLTLILVIPIKVIEREDRRGISLEFRSF